MMKLNDHPLNLIQSFISSTEKDYELCMSIYKYIPLKTEDDRMDFLVPSQSLNSKYLEMMLDSLDEGYDLSFNSPIIISGVTKHFPLIDFTGELTPRKIEIIEDVLPKKYLDKLYIFSSGRSYHGYILHPISQKEWFKFMGTLLLLNMPNEEPVSDQRWVGHRLRAGYSSLRWSVKSHSDKNTLPRFEYKFYDFEEKLSGLKIPVNFADENTLAGENTL